MVREIEFPIARSWKIGAHPPDVNEQGLRGVPHRSPSFVAKTLGPVRVLVGGGAFPVALDEAHDDIPIHSSILRGCDSDCRRGLEPGQG